jgi:RNA-directed DNA polymerase
MKEEMETLYTEGVAIHGGPESCVGDPRGRSEALTGVHVGRAIEPRNNHFGVPTLSPRWKATLLRRYREPLVGPARSENQGMRGAFMRENREIP